jgi:hypothetical protein
LSWLGPEVRPATSRRSHRIARLSAGGLSSGAPPTSASTDMQPPRGGRWSLSQSTSFGSRTGYRTSPGLAIVRDGERRAGPACIRVDGQKPIELQEKEPPLCRYCHSDCRCGGAQRECGCFAGPHSRPRSGALRHTSCQRAAGVVVLREPVVAQTDRLPAPGEINGGRQQLSDRPPGRVRRDPPGGRQNRRIGLRRPSARRAKRCRAGDSQYLLV